MCVYISASIHGIAGGRKGAGITPAIPHGGSLRLKPCKDPPHPMLHERIQLARWWYTTPGNTHRVGVKKKPRRICYGWHQKHKIGRIPSHKASQKFSISSFDSALEGDSDGRIYL